MIMSQVFMFWLYLFSIIMFFNFSSPFFFWLVTEVNLLFFVYILSIFSELDYKQSFQDLILYYFVIQSVSSILILSDFFFCLDFYIFNSNFLFMLSMLIKLGMFPFFFWVFKVSFFLSSVPLSVMLGMQKIPFFLVLFSSFNNSLFFLMVMSFISGSLMIFFSKNVVDMLICSSISYSFWIFYIYNISFFLILLFFLLYSMVIFFIVSMKNNLKLESWLLIVTFMFFLGLSPMGIFFFKFMVVTVLLESYSFMELSLFWIFSLLTLFGYMKFCYKSFFPNNFLYCSIKMEDLIKSMFCFVSMIFFFFFLVY